MRYELTSEEKALLLARPHRTKLYLVVDRPTAVLTARVNNGAIATGARAIVYDNESGDEAKVLAGMTLRVGTTPGGKELGVVRVRAINAGTNTLTVAENSIAWADNAYLSVLPEFRLWSVYPRVTYASSVLNWLKDYDVDYNTSVYRKQNVWLPPVPIMGPPAVAFLDDGAAVVKFVGDGSYTICPNGIKISGVSQGDVGVSATCAWAFEGGTDATKTTLGTKASPHSIAWDTAGRYLASLTVSNDKPAGGSPVYAKSTTGYRPVFILNRPGTAGGVNEPHEHFQLMRCEGDFASGGWQATLRVFGDADINEFPGGAMIVLFAEEWYGDTPQSIGGYPYRENVKLVAWITGESVRHGWDPQSGERYVEFTVQTADGLMKTIEANAVTIEDRPSMSTGNTEADEWWQMFKLQVNRAALFLLYWHTTLIPMADVNIVSDNSRVGAHDFPAGSIYRQIDDYAGGAILGRMLSDRQSSLFLERDIQLETGGARTARVTVLDLHNDTHLDGEFQAQRQHAGQTRFVEVSGVAWNGNDATPIIAQAPGATPLQDGTDGQVKGLVIESQAEANATAGYVLAARNNPWPDVPLRFQGNHAYLDIAPQGWLTMSLDAQDTKRGLEWDEKKLTPRRVSMIYLPDIQVMRYETNTEAEATGDAGVTGDYVTPSPIPIPFEMLVLLRGWNGISYVGTEDGLYMTSPRRRYFELATPKASPFSTDPDVPLVVNAITFDMKDITQLSPIIATSQGVFRGTLDLGTYELSWSKLTIPNPPNTWSDSPAPTAADLDYRCVAINEHDTDEIFVAAYYKNGDGNCRSWLFYTEDDAANWSSIALYDATKESHGIVPKSMDTAKVQNFAQTYTRIYVTGRRNDSSTNYGLYAFNFYYAGGYIFWDSWLSGVDAGFSGAFAVKCPNILVDTPDDFNYVSLYGGIVTGSAPNERHYGVISDDFIATWGKNLFDEGLMASWGPIWWFDVFPADDTDVLAFSFGGGYAGQYMYDVRDSQDEAWYAGDMDAANNGPAPVYFGLNGSQEETWYGADRHRLRPDILMAIDTYKSDTPSDRASMRGAHYSINRGKSWVNYTDGLPVGLQLICCKLDWGTLL